MKNLDTTGPARAFAFVPTVRTLRRFLGMSMLLIAAILVSRPAVAGDLEDPSASAGMDEYGVYIEYYLPAKNNDGTNHRVTDGNVYFNGGLILHFNASNNDDDDFHIDYHVYGGYFRLKGRTEGFTGMRGSGSAGSVRDGTGGSNTTLVARFYLSQSLLDKSNSSHLYQYVSATGIAKDPGDENYYFSTSISNPVPVPTVKVALSQKPGKMDVQYSFSGNIGAGQGAISHWATYGEETVTDNTNASPSGTIHTAITNTAETQDFYTQLECKGGYFYYYRSVSFTVPAYIWPVTLDADYDQKDSVTISWTVPKPPGGSPFIKGDYYEVGRSDDSTFSDENRIVQVARIQYDSTKTGYKVYDDLKSLKGGSHIYYRLRRTATADDWKWATYRGGDVNIDMNTTQKGDTAQLTYDAGTPEAEISWEAFRGVWTTGTKVSLKKFNRTTGALAATIDLTEADARRGTYVDENISYCNEFTYSIVVQLGGGFDSPSEEKIPGSILAVNIGTIDGLEASKGYYPDRTELRWHSQGIFDSYIIKRRIYGSGDGYIQITTVPGANASDVQTDDAKGTPGVYYQYMVIGAVTCNNELRYSRDTLYAIGFRSPTGNIYGRVTYQNGQAVSDVAVRLESQDGTRLGQSVYVNGGPQSYLKTDTLQVPPADSAFTLEAWIRPDDDKPAGQVLFSRAGQYAAGFNGEGQLYFRYGNADSLTATYENKNSSFVHVAFIHRTDSLVIMLGDTVMASGAISFAPSTGADPVAYIGGDKSGGSFKGYIDEMRLWNRALTPGEVARYYTSLVTGGEPGLAAYWRFDETIRDQFYDLAHQGDQYNRNDGVMNGGEVKHTDVIPTFSQLALKAFTDTTGNYMISGVPYTGVNGTTYKIVPLLGTHQFDPVSVNRLVSAASSSFSVDFTDKSSFPVSGRVYYSHTLVPVSGVQFKIDGQYAQRSNGDIIETDASGAFSISVPVGTHEVKAVKSNHVFEGDGKITYSNGENLNYQGPVSERVLRDSTTVRVIGRVAGGPIQDAYPLGHSLSANNLGRNLSVSIRLPITGKYSLNEDGGDRIVSVDHLLPSDETDSSHLHHTWTEYKPDTVIVHPDSLTGEFAVDLIPEQFIVDRVMATGWGDVLDGTPVTMDLTGKFARQYSVYAYKDSTQNSQGNWTYTNYSDTVAYNDSYKFIERVTPLVSIVQLDGAGRELPYFGDTIYNYQSFTGANIDIPVVDNTQPDPARYLFGNPVFAQNKTYHFGISAYESYPFYDHETAGGEKVVAQKNGKDVTDNVPTQDGFVSIYNDLRDGAATADTMSLDAEGHAVYDFTVGDPELTQGIKTFAASVRFGAATNISWQWDHHPQLSAFIIGGKLTGTDFVTAGPDELLAVLRDPPGSRSYSYMESGSTIASSKAYIGSFDQVGDEDLVTKLGAELVTFTGVGVGTINSAVTSEGIGFGVHHEEHYTGTDTWEQATTLTTRFTTSEDPAFVGAAGDLFVGYSTNITYGQSNNIAVIPRSELKPADSVIYQADPASPSLIVRRTGINIGQRFGTLFAYPQQHLEKVLIPNLIKIRNSLLLPMSTTPVQAQQAADFSKAPVYVSKLDASDPNFGKSNNDSTVFGKIVKTLPFDNGKSYTIYFPSTSLYRTDTIMVLNQYVQQWEDRMAANEKAKLDAKLLQNYSFHAGSPIEYSEQTTYDTVKTNSFNIIVSGSVTNSTDVDILGNGFTFTFNESVGTGQGGEFSSTNSTDVTHGFVLAADGSDDYLSVDVDKASDGSFAFRTKGGVTGCPYLGATETQYYQPGTPLDEPTERVEVPVLSVDNPVVNDIPSSRKASYTLHLRNESEAQLPASFLLSYGDVDSVKGAAIAVDGSLIGGTGRVIVVPYGETVTKVLTLTKGPDAMDYNNIPIILHSSCQYDPVGYQRLIADTVLISAHFIPSCSDIHLKDPPDQWILNTAAPVNSQGKRYLPVTLDGFDVTNNLFDHIELKYKPSASSQWITLMKYYSDSAKLKDAQGAAQFITNAQEIKYNVVMDDASFSDQKYDIRAESVCALGPAEVITTPSNVASGLKDTYNPRLFGSPQPPNGVLGIDDEIRLNFNEPIADGLLTPANFHVTGIRNGARGDHTVSVQLDGVKDHLVTEFNKNLAGKDLTVEMWVLPDGKEDGTLFSQGDANQSLEMAFTKDGYLRVVAGTQAVESDKPLDYKAGEWAHVALVYNAQTGKVSAFYNFTEVIHDVAVGTYEGTGPFDFGRSIAQAGNFFAGRMHGVRVWTEVRSVTLLQEKSLVRLSGAENNLMALYPMDEGKGDVAFDKAHGANAALTGRWSTPPGKAVRFDGNGYVKLNTATTPVTGDMDYTVSLWFKAAPGQADAALLSNGKGDGTDPDTANSFFLGFEGGLLTFENNGFKVQADGNFLDDAWHHVAVSVNRNSGTSQLFVDGALNRYFDARNLGGLASPYMYVGARAWYDQNNAVTPHLDSYFRGEVDEVRLWNTYLDQALVSKNNNSRLNGDELGLLFYYPFEHYIEFQNNKELSYTLGDQKQQADPQTSVPDAVAFNATQTDETAPIKDRGPVDNLQFSYVVNNDALIINMQEPRQAIDKTIVTFQVDGVRDRNGNTLVSPVTWSAYIDQNQLKWSDDELNLTKDLYQPMQFESYVVNSGGNIENFRLDNLPSWLTAEPSSGQVAPEGKQRITFTVNEGLNVGAYDEIVYMRNDNDESEALALNLKVKGQTPDWQVNPADFKYSMSVVGKLRFDNIFSDDPEDMVAAFIDGKCVGVAHSAYQQQGGLWFCFLTVYADTTQYEPLEFRLWDASTGKIYQGIPSIPISFKNNAVFGTSREPVVLDGKELFFQNIRLAAGWNWISFNLNQQQGSVQGVLAAGSWQPGDLVKNELLGFDQYSLAEGWVGYLKGVNNTDLFMLNTQTAQTLSTAGTLVDLKQTPITVRGGRWNYISYLPQVNVTVTEALAGYAASDDDVIKSQTGFAIYDSRNGWVGNLTYLEPGKGYMLYRKAAADTKFTYPVISGSLIHRQAAATELESARLNPGQLPVTSNFAYADNMTVIAVADGFTLLPGDKVLAYAGTELRGQARLMDNPVTGSGALFFNIAGRDNQPVRFVVTRGDKVMAETGPVMGYSSNSLTGTLHAPFMLHFSKSAVKTGIFPNPFSRQLTLTAALTAGTHEIQVSIYDLRGKLVKHYQKQTIKGRSYQLSWDGSSDAGVPAGRGAYFIHLEVDGQSHVYKVVKY